MYPYYNSSPIWFYSNANANTTANATANAFTFQSGSILMQKPPTVQQSLPTSFTFQSGSILIPFNISRYFALVLFTFQSGSILMPESINFQRNIPNIYIPIWFYSNEKSIPRRNECRCIYIPIWFYSNETARILKSAGYRFTFQSGSILIALRICSRLHPVDLHSNLVLF